MIDYKLKASSLGDVSVVSATLSPAPGDASARIQAAIDEVAANGGGTLLLEAGEYVLEKTIVIRRSVVVRGEKDPTDKKGGDTVLLAKAGRNDPDGDAQIVMEACTGLKDAVIYYPELSIDEPVPYSPAVRQRGVDSITVENVVLVNPWRGIQCGPDANELHFVKNVYMTPLDIGLYMDMTTDIGRLQGMHITPDCYAEYTSTPIEKVREYTLAHTTALFMARSDWEYAYDVSAEYCRIGMKITAVKDSGPNAQISAVKLYNCSVAIDVVNVNPYGIALSDSVISCDIDGLEAAILTRDSFKTVVQLNGVDFRSPRGGYRNIVKLGGSGFVSFVDCTFENKNTEEAAAYVANGGTAFINCEFGSDGADIVLDGRVSGAQILGCGSVKLENRTSVIAEYSEERRDFPKASRGGFKKYPYNANAAKELLFNVLDYGAERNTGRDSTEEIRNAVKAAENAGGGIVYFPGGRYTVEGTLNVPTGVELRGVAEVPMHTMGGGSVLITNHGKGDENAEPFVTLEERSGIRGLLFYNLDQDSRDPIPYPFAVQSRGKYCYVINAVFVNMWQSLDMGTYPSEGHYISYISGAPFKCGAFLGSNEGEGWVENMQFNPHYWFRSDLPNHPDNRNWHAFWHNQMKYLDALKFGYNENEHLLGTFVFAARHGLAFEKQNGRGTKGKFIGHGTDSGLIALYLSECEDVELINTQLVNIEAEGRRSYIYSTPEAGKYRIYNTLMWGDPHYAAIFDGGKIFIEQMNIVAPGKAAITVNGGELEVVSVFFMRENSLCEINGGKSEFYAPAACGLYKNNGENSLKFEKNEGDAVIEYRMVKE